MPRSYPPLTALRTFEAAARLGNFTKAASELHVTPAAVSHQIRGLERYLGVRLFSRTGRVLVLTEAAHSAAMGLRDGFERIYQSVEHLHQDERWGTLAINVTPAFASRWLVARLARFQEKHAGIQLRIVASSAPVDFEQDDIDVAIRIGRGGFDDIETLELFSEYVAPVAAPSFLRRHPCRRTSDVLKAPLLHDDSMRRSGRPQGWHDWQKFAGIQTASHLAGTHYDDGHLALQAAATGAGIALGRLVYAFDDLVRKQLRIAVPPVQKLDLGYYLLVPSARIALPGVQAFREWIQVEAASFRRDFERMLKDGSVPKARGSRKR